MRTDTTTRRHQPTRGFLFVAALALTLLASGCTAALPDAHARPGPGATSGTVWLCRPDDSPDPCTRPLASTTVPAHGARSESAAKPSTDSPFDCFYVYPTVSTEPRDNSDLTVQTAERQVAALQASRFSPLCSMWAPMYRQRTDASLKKGIGGDPQADEIAYASLLAAWKDYLAHDNRGRPIVIIGHSQGAALLTHLLAAEVDATPALRDRLVIAILPGANVTVPVGKSVGATFQNLPLCTANGQSGCVIAYSSFPSMPPKDAVFGRPGQGVSAQVGPPIGTAALDAVQVACTNPAALAGGAAPLHPYFPTVVSTPPPPAVSTPWVDFPGLYEASCRSAEGAGWLQVDTVDAAGRPVVEDPLASWGYHSDDINLALGDLVAAVDAAEQGYLARAH